MTWTVTRWKLLRGCRSSALKWRERLSRCDSEGIQSSPELTNPRNAIRPVVAGMFGLSSLPKQSKILALVTCGAHDKHRSS